MNWNLIDDKVNARELYSNLEVKTPFSKWIKRSLDYVLAVYNKDFWTKLSESTGGRRPLDYTLNIDCAKEVALVQPTKKSKEVRLSLIELDRKRANLELITPKEAALAYEYINFFKYIENQKQAYVMHKDYFVKSSPISKFVYAEFAKHRENITGWNKDKVNDSIITYLKTKAGHNFTKLMKLSMSDKLSIIDINEAIRVSILDLLFSRGTQPELANKFANMVKNVSKEMDVLALRRNENNLFQQKESVNLKSIE